MMNEEGEGYSYPMLERKVRNPVIKETFEERMIKLQEIADAEADLLLTGQQL